MNIIIISAIFLVIIIECHGFNSVTGVGFSPYTKKGVNWNDYSYDDIKAQLNTVGSKFKWISTYSMGVNQWNKNNNWDQADGNCLIAKAASDLNQRNNAQLKVSIGIYQNGDDRSIENKEIENAFKAAEDANQRSRGTVWGIVFTNEYITTTDTANRVLQMIRQNKNRGLRVGTRIHVCGIIMDENNKIQPILAQIARESHFIMCNMYPAKDDCQAQGPRLEGVRRSISGIGNAFLRFKNKFQSYNSGLEVMIGETGWASYGPTFNKCPNNVDNMKNFWWGMSEWGRQNNVKIHFFEGIDEPWKGPEEGEKHFGWWYRNGNQSPPNLVEKAAQ